MVKKPMSRLALSALTLCIALTGCTRYSKEKPKGFLERGRAFVAKKDYSRAVLEFRNAIKSNPNDAEPYYQIGLVSQELGDIVGALAAFQKATALNPKHAEAQLKVAALLSMSGNKEVIENAKKRVVDVLAEHSDSTLALDTLAVAEFRLGKPSDAVKLLEQAVKAAPADLLSAALLARAKLNLKDFVAAEAVMKNAVANAPQSPRAALALGIFYISAKRAADAESALQRALQLDATLAPALYALATLQRDENRKDDAEATLKRLAATSDKKLRPLYGLYLFQSGKRDGALAEFQRIVTKDPQDRAARTLLVAAYVEMNNVPEAQKVLARALKQNPKDSEALRQRSELSLRSGDVASAESDLNQVLRFEADSPEVHVAVARLKRVQRLFPAERQHLTEALRLNPAHIDARARLAWSFLQANEPKAALDILDMAPAANKNDPKFVILRNWGYIATNNIREARAGIDQALRVARTPVVLLQDGVLKLNQGDSAAARNVIEEALKSRPEDLTAARMLVKTYGARKEWPQAVERVRQLVAQRPQSPALQLLLGEVLLQAGDRANARKAYETATAVEQGSSDARLALARLDVAEENLNGARANAGVILERQPTNVPALLLAAEVEIKSRNQPAALGYYKSILNVDKSNLEALNNLAYLIALEDPNEALPLAEHAMELAPESATVCDTMGWVFYRKGMYTSAIQHLKRAVAYEATPRRQYHLAMSYLKVGQRDLGYKTLEVALKQDSSLPKTEVGW